MKEPIFTGACTALVTPFLGEQINYPLLEQLIARQVEQGIHAIVLGGTTGEGATLSDGEKLEMVHRARAYVGDDCLVLAGTGSNDTRHAVALSVAAQQAGADALLVVSPYYNKANPAGLYAHYCAIAHSVQIPVVLYNVPSRTGLDMPVSVYRALSELPNVAGVKEASSDLGKTLTTLTACPGDFYVWSGCDELAVPALSVGAKGVISVVSNLLPRQVQDMTQAALAGDFDTAADLQKKLLPLIRLLFREVNPIPVKAAMELMGYDCGPCRLPLGDVTPDLQKELEQCLDDIL